MKKITFIIYSFLVASFTSYAQFTVTHTDMELNSMFREKLRDLSSGTSGITPGSAGANQIWDFSSFINGEDTTEVTPGYTPISNDSLFPIANYKAEVSGVYDVKSYINLHAGGLDWLGTTMVYNQPPISQKALIRINPYQRAFPFPLTYNTIDTNNYETIQINEVAPPSYFGYDSAIVHSVGTSIQECDGWGTLITPLGTYNTLRIKGTETSSDTSFTKYISTGWQATDTSIRSSISYRWILSNGLEVASVSRYGLNTWQYTFYNYPNPVGISEFDIQEFEVYPNPTHSVLNINSEENSKILILNLLGETVADEYLKVGNNRIDVSRLKNGIYFIQTEKGNVSKFVKN